MIDTGDCIGRRAFTFCQTGARTHDYIPFIEPVLLERTCKEGIMAENLFGRIETKTKRTETKAVYLDLFYHVFQLKTDLSQITNKV